MTKSPRVEKGLEWAKNVTYMWVAFAGFKALFGLGLENPVRHVVEAAILGIAGPLMTAPLAFAAGWVFSNPSKKTSSSDHAARGRAANSVSPRLRKKIPCTKCRQEIVFNARLCPHCGTHFPYLAEPARSHVEQIERLFLKGLSEEEIAAALNAGGIRPASQKQAWTANEVTQIIQDHVT